MNKRELKAIADALVGKISHLERVSFDSSELAALINLPHLQKLKASLQHNFLVKIAALPDEMPPLPMATVPTLEAAEAIWTTYNYINKALRNIEKECMATVKKVEAVFVEDISVAKFLLKQERFNKLVASVMENFTSCPFPDLASRLVDALNSSIKRVSKSEKESAHTAAIAILELFCKFITVAPSPILTAPDYYRLDNAFLICQTNIAMHRAAWPRLLEALVEELNGPGRLPYVLEMLAKHHSDDEGYCAAAFKRYDILASAEVNYLRAVEHKNAFLFAARNLRALSDESRRVIGCYDAELANDIKHLQEEILAWDSRFANSPVVYFNGDDAAIPMMEAPLRHRECGAFFDRLQRLDAQIGGLHIIIGVHIARKEADFNFFDEQLREHFSEERGASAELATLRREYDVVGSMDMSNLNALHEKLQCLMIVTEKSQRLLGQLTIRGNERLNRQIRGMHETKIKRIQRLEDNIRTAGYVFSEGEAAFVEQIKRYRSTPVVSGDIVPDHEGLCAKRTELFSQIPELRRFEELLENHALAKDMVRRNNINELIHRLNETTTAETILRIIGQYLTPENESNFLAILSNELHQIRPSGLLLLKTFMLTKEGGVAAEIKRKLAFIDLVSAAHVQHHAFLNKPNAISAAIVLEELGLQAFITQETLSNDLFCNALQVLKEREIRLTAPIVQLLLFDGNKCDIITQQDTWHRSTRGVMHLRDDIFKALLENFLHVPSDVAHALCLVKSMVSSYCTPSLIVLIKEHDLLRSLICSYDLRCNLPFLIPLLEDVAQIRWSVFLYLQDYLSTNPFTHEFGKQQILNSWFSMEQGQKALNLLWNVNQSRCPSLARMSALMKKLNEFVEHHSSRLSTAELAKLMHFRKDAILILLNNQPEARKKKAFEALAYRHFEHPDYRNNILKDVLQFITGLFVIVMPIRCILGYSALFSHNKSEMNNNASLALEEALRTTLP